MAISTVASEGDELSRRLADESVTLLKNEEALLPLSRDVKKVAVLGPHADSTMVGFPHYTYPAAPSMLRIAGTGVLPSQPTDIPAAVAAAQEADVVILYVGGKAGWYGDDLTEKEGRDTADIDLPPQQVELVNAVTAVGKPTVAVVAMGRPQGLAAVIDRLSAVLTAYSAGPHQGTAIADALFGVANPGGKLPVTLPRHVGQVPIHHGQHTGSG